MSKKVLITGGSDGIGAKITEVFANNNYDVFICGRNIKKLTNTAHKFNLKGFLAIDLTKDNAASELFKKAEETLGFVDILINNAGQYFYGAVENTGEKEIKNLMTLNVQVPYELITYCVPNMKKQNWGRIINIGSISGVVGEANASLYSLTKSAFAGMTKALALELARNNITVNTINPGFVQTNLLENTFDDDFTKDELLDMIPQGRFIEPVEIANFAKYLASEEAKGLTGQSINLCAGMSVGS